MGFDLLDFGPNPGEVLSGSLDMDVEQVQLLIFAGNGAHELVVLSLQGLDVPLQFGYGAHG
jgi:hypothetical protein